MSPPHINNSLIMENNLQSCNLDGADFLQQMSPSPPPTTQGQDVTLSRADLHLNKYRPRRNNVRTQKRNRRLSSGHVQFILPDPAKLQGTIRRRWLPSWSIVQESPCHTQKHEHKETRLRDDMRLRHKNVKVNTYTWFVTSYWDWLDWLKCIVVFYILYENSLCVGATSLLRELGNASEVLSAVTRRDVKLTVFSCLRGGLFLHCILSRASFEHHPQKGPPKILSAPRPGPESPVTC